jgi:hypothetical protein
MGTPQTCEKLRILGRLPGSLSNLGLIDCASGGAAHCSEPFRQIVMTILLKRSKNQPHSPTWLATIAQIRQAPV